MTGAGKKNEAGSPGVVGWISSACRFATDRNDFRRLGYKAIIRGRNDLGTWCHGSIQWDNTGANNRNLLVNLGLFAAGVWVARNLSDFDLMSPQPVT